MQDEITYKLLKLIENEPHLNQREIAQKMGSTLPLENIANLFNLPVDEIGISGSVGIEFVPSQIHDIDLIFYGKDVAKGIWNKMRDLVNEKPVYFNKLSQAVRPQTKYLATRFIRSAP